MRTMPGKGVYVKKINDAFIRDEYLKETEEALSAAVRCGKLAGLSVNDLHKILDRIGRTGE